jgi:hypothetical protein
MLCKLNWHIWTQMGKTWTHQICLSRETKEICRRPYTLNPKQIIRESWTCVIWSATCDIILFTNCKHLPFSLLLLLPPSSEASAKIPEMNLVQCSKVNLTQLIIRSWRTFGSQNSCISESNSPSAQCVTLQIKTGWRKVKTCWFTSTKWFWPSNLAQFAEACRSHSKA